MSLMEFFADVDSDLENPARKMAETARENAEMERQTLEDVKEFLADEAAGKNHSMIDVSGKIGKGIVGFMMVVSLGGIFSSCAQRAMAEQPAAVATVQVQQKTTANYPTQTITLSR